MQTAHARTIRVASIGECMIELRHTSPTDLVMGFGGDTLNTAVYLARVGAAAGIAVEYVTALGDDPYSETMLAAWHAEGVGTALVSRLPGRLPGLYLIRTDARGERSFSYFRSTAAAREMLRGEAGQIVAERLAGFDLVYLSGITLSILDAPQRAVLIDALDAVRAKGGRVAFDSNFRPAGWPDHEEARSAFTAVLRRTDIALPTLDDETRLFGDADAEGCVARLHDLGVPEVVVKLGAGGCWLSGTTTAPCAAEPVETVVDTTAAGDSFNGGYLAARLNDRPPAEAARLGHRVAATVIRHPGAVIPRSAMPALDPG